MDQDTTWYGGRPRPWPHCVRCWPSPPQGHSAPQFPSHVFCGQLAGWIKMPLGNDVDLGPGKIQISAHVCCCRTAGWIKMSLCAEVGFGPGDVLLMGIQLPLKGAQQPHFSAHYIVAKQLGRSRCHLLERWTSAQAILPCLLWPNSHPSQLLLSSC